MLATTKVIARIAARATLLFIPFIYLTPLFVFISFFDAIIALKLPQALFTPPPFLIS
jgi:hypothetical protein